MLIFLDTADLSAIKRYAQFVEGVTTNPKLIAKAGITKSHIKEHVIEICNTIKQNISVEVYSLNHKEMIEEGIEYASWNDAIIVKLPCTVNGLIACQELTKRGIKTNVTLIFSPLQALLAAKSGATIVSPFVGRVEDAGFDGISLIESIRDIFDNYNYKTQVLAASFRTVSQIRDVALIGSDIATISPELFEKMIIHPFTDSGLKDFLNSVK